MLELIILLGVLGNIFNNGFVKLGGKGMRRK